MTKVFIIAIVMWWSDPSLTPSNDSVEITHLHGKPLYFETVEDCSNHIDKNFQALKNYGKFIYPTSHTVKTIYCVPRDRKINNNFT